MHSVHSRTRILFVGEAVTLAHVARPYMLASSLRSNEFEVHFAAAPHYTGIFTNSGTIRHHNIYSQTPAQFERILRTGGILYTEETLRHYVEEDIQLLNKISPDIVVGDMRLSLAVSASLLQIPYIAISNAIWSPYAVEKQLPAPTFAPLAKYGLARVRLAQAMATRSFNRNKLAIFKAQADGLDKVRSSYGLNAFPDYLTGFTFSDYTLYADIPSIVPTQNLPSNHKYAGAICWEPATTLPKWFEQLRNDTPVIYISLGSSGDLNTLESIINGLHPLNLQIIVATGGRKSSITAAPNIFITDFLPGATIARRASIVITNGGSPSTYQALREGTPVLGIAANMDQLLTMTAVDATGAGVLLRADITNKKNVLSAAIKLLRNSSYKESALRLATEFSRYNAAQILEESISELLETPTLKIGQL